MKTIHKYILRDGDSKISVPINHKVLSVGNQDDKVCVWIEVNTRHKLSDKVFEVYCTGQQIPDGNRKFIGTVLLDSGCFVLHVYERLS